MAEVAVVTGASAGIGWAYAEALAARGYDLVAVGRRAERLDELATQVMAEHGVQVDAVAADLADDDDVARLCRRLATAPPELLVNNAGLAHYKPFADLPPEQARELIDVNVTAPVLLTRAVLPGMVARGSGAVVNIASLLAFSGAATAEFMPKRAVYAATKSFIVTYTQILAGELAGTGVRVQVVCPGIVRTEFHSRQGMDPSRMQAMTPGLLVRASLADLDAGILVSVPGHPDPAAAMAALTGSQAVLTSAARATELPDRYESPATNEAAGGSTRA